MVNSADNSSGSNSPVSTTNPPVITAIVTPVDPAGSIDHDGLDRAVDRVLAGGVHGVSPCGSTGEGARLTLDQRLEVARRVRARAPQATVIPGVPVTAVPLAHEELAELGRLDVTAALVPPPSYYPSSDDELLRLYIGLADTSPVPIVLYNIPVFTDVMLPVGVVARLAEHPRIVGIKDSSRDMEYLQSVVMAVRDASSSFTVYTGTDTLLVASLLTGAGGALTASSNLVPELVVEVAAAFTRGDLDHAGRVQRRLAEVVDACRRGAAPAGWKAALHLAGVCGPDLVPPASVLPAVQVEELRDALVATDVLVASGA
ncbi:MAG TPA: dihydrodipicolinate synthase family protein [Jiangellaceae bacterium]|nr:dihydrodipicolinate synthase family protein [Jiangellaceae bacterium]